MTTTGAEEDGAGGDPAMPLNGDVRVSLDDLLPGGFIEAFETAMSSMEIAEGLIEELGQQHTESADLIWHSFGLLRPTHGLMHKTDMIYRSHCREILQRVIDGADTRPGTAAECCIVCCETSQLAPLTVAGVGAYTRMWQAAGLPDIGDGVSAEHHEALRGPAIDEHERVMRKKLSALAKAPQRHRALAAMPCHSRRGDALRPPAANVGYPIRLRTPPADLLSAAGPRPGSRPARRRPARAPATADGAAATA